MTYQISPYLFLEMLEKLKNIQRSGWIRRGVEGRLESVSDHMYRVTVMCRMAPGVESDQVIFSV